MFLCKASTSCCLRNSPSEILRALFTSVVHKPLNFSTGGVRLDGRFKTTYCLFHDVEERALGWKQFKLCVYGGNGRVSVGRRSVINKDHRLVRI